MGFKILHLSDFHFSEQNKENHFSKLQSLIDSIKNLENQQDKLLIIVSGDIAFSGKKAEYSYAADFFQSARFRLKNHFKQVMLYFVPGNHDCDFSQKYLQDREIKINDALNSEYRLSDEDIRYISRPLGNYFNFEEKNSNYMERKSLLQNYQRISNDEILIDMFLLNSAWMSSLHENKNILMPKKYFDFATKQTNKKCITFSFITTQGRGLFQKMIILSEK